MIYNEVLKTFLASLKELYAADLLSALTLSAIEKSCYCFHGFAPLFPTPKSVIFVMLPLRQKMRRLLLLTIIVTFISLFVSFANLKVHNKHITADVSPSVN